MPVATAEFPVGNFVYEEMHSADIQQLDELWNDLIYRTGGKINIYMHIESGSVERVLEHLYLLLMPNFKDDRQRLP